MECACQGPVQPEMCKCREFGTISLLLHASV
jgi:hypothetical protein